MSETTTPQARPSTTTTHILYALHTLAPFTAWTLAIVLFELCFAFLIWNRLARPLLLGLALPIWIGTALLTGMTSWVLMIGTASSEQVEDLVDIALSECERFYPAFQLVIWGGKTPEEAMAAAMIEPIGEA